MAVTDMEYAYPILDQLPNFHADVMYPQYSVHHAFDLCIRLSMSLRLYNEVCSLFFTVTSYLLSIYNVQCLTRLAGAY